jgi:hypothetical protein
VGADRLVQLLRGARLVGNAQRLQPAERLFGKVGVEDHQVGRLDARMAVEVDPVHHADRFGLVVVVELLSIYMRPWD